MTKTNPIIHSFGHAVLVVVYVTLITRIMAHAPQLFGKMQTFWGPIAFLLLFVCSATITGTLVLGRPLLLYLDNQKREALRFFGMTLGWLIVITVLLMIMLAVNARMA